MTFELYRARSEQDREELFRFRYRVYVEEMGRYRGIADHDGQRLVEPEDAHSVIYGAREDGDVVATARTTFGTDGFSARQIGQYSLRPFLDTMPAELMAVGERMMVEPSLRGSTIGSRMREMIEQEVTDAGVRLMFGNCEPHLLSLYLAGGARTYAEHNISSEEAGYLIPLVWLIGDIEDMPPDVGDALAHREGVYSAAAMPPDEYWAYVESTLERLEQEELHAFAGFDPAETRECISRSTIIKCEQGDRVLKEGGSSHNLFLVLDGTLEVRYGGKLVNVLRSGDVFGEMAFLLDVPRQSDVYAATPDVRILSLSDGTLHKLMAEEPALASKLLLNISRMLCGRLIRTTAAI